MSRLVVKMKKKLYLPVLLILLASLVFGVLPIGSGVAYASPGWVSPTGFVDGGSVWTDEPLAYDEDTLTFAYVSCPAGWCDYLELTIAEITCDKVRLWMGRVNTQVEDVAVDVYYNSAWDNIYSGSFVVGSFQEFAIGSKQLVTAMRIRFFSSKANRQAEIYEAEFNEVVPLPSIINTPDNYPFGTVAESSTTETGLTHFTVTNNSAFAVNITISGTDMTGGTTWTLSNDGSAGNMIYGLNAGLGGGSYNVVVRRDPAYNTLVSGLAGGETTQQWGLQLLAPTTMSDGASKSGTVTLTATAV